MPLATGSVKPVFEEGLEEFPLNMSVSRFSTEDSLKFCPAPVGATKEEFSYGYSARIGRVDLRGATFTH